MFQSDCAEPKSCTGLIYGFQHESLSDRAGMSTTILFKGCSFSCWWCPNPELQSATVELSINGALCVRCGACIAVCFMGAAREGAGDENEAPAFTTEREECIVCGACVKDCAGGARTLVGRRMAVTEVLEEIDASQSAAGLTCHEVVCSGGEPLLQSHFLEELLKTCKNRGMSTTVDTLGNVPYEVIERIRPWADTFRFGLNFFDNLKHWEFTGLPNAQILNNIETLSKAQHQLIIRVPIIPGINNDIENQTQIAAFAAGLPHLLQVDLQPYRRVTKEQFERLGKPYRPLDESEMGSAALDQLVDLYRKSGLRSRVRLVGVEH